MLAIQFGRGGYRFKTSTELLQSAATGVTHLMYVKARHRDSWILSVNLSKLRIPLNSACSRRQSCSLRSSGLMSRMLWAQRGIVVVTCSVVVPVNILVSSAKITPGRNKYAILRVQALCKRAKLRDAMIFTYRCGVFWWRNQKATNFSTTSFEKNIWRDTFLPLFFKLKSNTNISQEW